MVVYFTTSAHNFLNFFKFLLVGLYVLVVFKLDHAHPYDFFLQFLNVSLVLVVDGLAFGDAGGENFITGPALEDLMSAIELGYPAHFVCQCFKHHDLGPSSGFKLEDSG
jgi:hypothetical protein